MPRNLSGSHPLTEGVGSDKHTALSEHKVERWIRASESRLTAHLSGGLSIGPQGTGQYTAAATQVAAPAAISSTSPKSDVSKDLFSYGRHGATGTHGPPSVSSSSAATTTSHHNNNNHTTSNTHNDKHSAASHHKRNESQTSIWQQEQLMQIQEKHEDAGKAFIECAMQTKMKQQAAAAAAAAVPHQPNAAGDHQRKNALPSRFSMVEHNQLCFLISDCPSSDAECPAFKNIYLKHGVTHVVRVCEPLYRISELQCQEIQVHDWPFENGVSPPQQILSEWLILVDQMAIKNAKSTDHKECIAIHCMTGLNRGPMLVAIAFIEYGMSASEAVGLIRSMRRGAISVSDFVILEEYVKRDQRVEQKVPASLLKRMQGVLVKTPLSPSSNSDSGKTGTSPSSLTFASGMPRFSGLTGNGSSNKSLGGSSHNSSVKSLGTGAQSTSAKSLISGYQHNSSSKSLAK